jgi:hypothetical protein
MGMFGSITVKARPLRLAFLVDPNDTDQAREAIRLASSIWGGAYFPIIPMYERMPKSWRDGPLKAPNARKVITGYIDAFDPDILVQISTRIPKFVADAGLRIVKPGDIW